MNETETRIAPTMTVNTAILLHPRTVAVFDRYGIDSCCGGALPIEEVAKRHALDLDALMAELREAAGEGSPAT
jgi:regulator of cell morphogenesis and NO signaling